MKEINKLGLLTYDSQSGTLGRGLPDNKIIHMLMKDPLKGTIGSAGYNSETEL